MQKTAIARAGSCPAGWLTLKLIRVMRITAALLLAASLHVAARTEGQKVTLKVKDLPMKEVFRQIQKQTGLDVLVDEGLLEKADAVTLDVHNMPVSQVLALCLKNEPMSFSISEGRIIVKPSQSPKSNTASSSSVENMTPPVEIHGRVTDSLGHPLAGASVFVKGKGKQKGTETDANGNFMLTGIAENSTLVISYTGYTSRQFAVNSGGDLAVILDKSNSPLDEIQVIAYGTTTKRYIVGNVTTVTGEEIAKQPVDNPLLALEGRVPGLFITQNTGVPGGGITVRIHGQNSIAWGNDPLYVIDGVPYPSQLPQSSTFDGILNSSGAAANLGNQAAGNPLSFVNPSDIESIEVLKDADATAIYGSRAANGAILITTKKGKAGKAKIEIDAQNGWGNVDRYLKMLDLRQYLDMRYEAYKNDGIALSSLHPSSSNYDLTLWDTTRSTDWQKLLIGGTAQYTTINGSVSGGTNTVQYLVGGTLHRTSTVFPGNFSDKSASFHYSLNTSSVDQRFHMQLSGQYIANGNNLPGIDLTKSANLLPPDAPPIFKSDGTLNWEPNASGTSTFTNPLVNVLYQHYQANTNNLISNLIIGYNILAGLELKSSFGYNNIQSTNFYSTPLTAFPPENRPFSSRFASYGNMNSHSWIIEPQLNFKRNIFNGKLDFLLGSTIEQNMNNAGGFTGKGYSNDQVLVDPNAAATISTSGFTVSEYKYNALFGRLNYILGNKYIININARRDGSSRFGSQNQFHDFGSIGGAWIFSEEAFMKKNISGLSFGKLRGSYGSTGNDQIGDYSFLSLYFGGSAGNPYQNSSTSFVGNLSNPYLEWEETKKIQLGIDLGFFNNRLLIDGTFGRNRSSNQLLQYILPTITGFSAIIANFPATVQNKSLEFSMTSSNIKGKYFNWTTSFNVTVPNNKLIAFPNLAQSSYFASLLVGQPIDITRFYHYLGVDPATGLYQFADSHGNATLSPNSETDHTVLISRFPKLYGGLENRISFKGFEVDIMFQFVKQKAQNNYYNNGTIFIPGVYRSQESNQPVTVLNRWQKPGDLASIQKFSSAAFGSGAFGMDVLIGSDAFITDASYARLKNLSLSWQMPDKWEQKIHLRNVRIYLHGQNVLTFTHYKGGDPESQGYSTLPPLRVLTLGLQLGL